MNNKVSVKNKNYAKRNILFFFTILSGLLFYNAGFSQTNAQKLQIKASTNDSALSQFAASRENVYRQEKQLAEQWAISNGLPVRGMSDGVFFEIQKLDKYSGMPQYYITHNINAARTISTDKVWTDWSGKKLNGADMTIGEWDSPILDLTQYPIVSTEFGTRLKQIDIDKDSSLNPDKYPHQLHVAGTMIAAGNNVNARGMANQAELRLFDWNNAAGEMAKDAKDNSLLFSNHSYGVIRGWQYNSNEEIWYWHGTLSVNSKDDYQFGFYDDLAKDWDEIAYAAQKYLIVKSAGNDRGDGPSDGTTHKHWDEDSLKWVLSDDFHLKNGASFGYDCLSHYAVAKNIITVGAVQDIPNGWASPTDVAKTSFSSWGPTDDGRIKPDIVANGTCLVSVWNGDNSNNCVGSSCKDKKYCELSGTSMAAPSVTGSLALLQEYYAATHGYNLMFAATLKALVIHTADEAGDSLGPDYEYGWGLMNTERAADMIKMDDWADKDDNIMEDTLTNNEIWQYKFTWLSDASDTFIKVTIVWTDPEGTPVNASLNPTDRMLVNDLDLRIFDSDQIEYYPWSLGGNFDTETKAVNNKDNNVDNVEQVYIKNPVHGKEYTIQVNHKGTLQNGQQLFSIITNGVSDIVIGDGDSPAEPECSGHTIDGPSVFSASKGITNCQTNFCNVVYALSGNAHVADWKLILYHKDGNFLIFNASNTSHFIINSPLTLPDYQWERDNNGNIYGEVFTKCTDGSIVSRSIKLTVPPNKPTLTIEPLSCTSVKLSYKSGGAEYFRYSYYPVGSSVAYLSSNQYNSSVIVDNLISTSLYNFYVLAYNSEGSASSDVEQIVLEDKPDASFTYTIMDDLCTPTKICFENTSTNTRPYTTYQWIHLYGVTTQKDPGCLTFTEGTSTDNIYLRATTCGSTPKSSDYSDLQSISLTYPPIFSIIASDTSICYGDPVTITPAIYNGTSGLTYNWSCRNSKNNSTIFSANTSSITFTPGVSCNCNLIIINSNTCSGSRSVHITVNPENAKLTLNAPLDNCDGTQILTASGGTSYSWTDEFGNNLGANNSIAIHPDSATTYSCSITDVTGCSKTISKAVDPWPTFSGPFSIKCLNNCEAKPFINVGPKNLTPQGGGFGNTFGNTFGNNTQNKADSCNYHFNNEICFYDYENSKPTYNATKLKLTIYLPKKGLGILEKIKVAPVGGFSNPGICWEPAKDGVPPGVYSYSLSFKNCDSPNDIVSVIGNVDTTWTCVSNGKLLYFGPPPADVCDKLPGSEYYKKQSELVAYMKIYNFAPAENENNNANVSNPIHIDILSITNNESITLKGSNLLFPSNGGIQILPGGKLNLIGSTVSACKCNTWKGVDLMGDDKNPGQLFMKNSVIENAETAIYMGKRGTNSEDTKVRGGRLITEGKNELRFNREGIFARGFERTPFEPMNWEIRDWAFVSVDEDNTNNPCAEKKPLTGNHIRFVGNTGAVIKDNIFNGYHTAMGLTAIKALDSHVKVENNEFRNGFDKGVELKNASKVEILKNQFTTDSKAELMNTRVDKAIHIESSRNIEIMENHFGKSVNTAVEMMASSDFKINKNEFYVKDRAIKTHENQMGSSISEIKENYFRDNNIAIQMMQDNHSKLEISCNSFENYGHFAILSENTILKDQGAKLMGAGNVFNSNSTEMNHQLHHNGLLMKYYYDPITPFSLTLNMDFKAQTIAASADNGCINSHSSKKGISESESINEEATLLNTNINISRLIGNIPNPYTNTTTIQYIIADQSTGSAEIVIHNILGKKVSKYVISKDNQELQIDCSNCVPGIYSYSLIIGNVVVDTKRMAVIK